MKQIQHPILACQALQSFSVAPAIIIFRVLDQPSQLSKDSTKGYIPTVHYPTKILYLILPPLQCQGHGVTLGEEKRVHNVQILKGVIRITNKRSVNL